MCEKKQLRKCFRALRSDLKNIDWDAKIARNALEAFGKYDRFFVYLSFGSEVGTEALIELLKKAGKRVCVPRIVDGEMLSVPLTDKLEEGAFGILAPDCGEEETCAVAFTPLLSADKEGYRLGYGGGFYDRYFAKHPGIVKVGLAYLGQITEKLPHEETDIPLDALVTENGVVRYERKE